MRIVLNIVGGLVALFLLILMIGTFTKNEHRDEATKVVPGDASQVYNFLRNVENIPERTQNAKSVEMLGLNNFGFPVWKQQLIFGGYVITDFIEDVPEERLIFRVKDGTIGLRGTWAYELLYHSEDSTKVRLIEQSVVSDVLLRSYITIMGRDVNVTSLLEELYDQMEKQLDDETF